MIKTGWSLQYVYVENIKEGHWTLFIHPEKGKGECIMRDPKNLVHAICLIIKYLWRLK